MKTSIHIPVILLFIILLAYSCEKKRKVRPLSPYISQCIDFDAPTSIYSYVPKTQTSFGTIVHLEKGVSFSARYEDDDHSVTPDFILKTEPVAPSWTPPNISNSQFSGQVLVLKDQEVLVDFTGLNFTNMQVEFDVIFDHQAAVNQFLVNGFPKNSLPPGVVYKWHFGGNNGLISFNSHVTITGPIKTLVLVNDPGFSVYDNLCFRKK